MKRMLAVIALAGVSLLAIGSADAQTTPAANDQPGTSDIVVTGSRIVTNGNNSPTPVTILTIDALASSKPTTIFEALLEQPLIAADKGGKVAGGTGQGGNNNSIAALNLRGLGATRGLVLYDGHRVPPQNLDGTIDLNQIPQLLLQRVDLQTGGSSAVYGSDAITGVVNFITDRKFKGLKVNVQGGISEYGDEPTYDVGAAYGTNLFGGRGHFEASVQYRNDAGLKRTDRDYIQRVGQPSYSLQGNGCAAGTTVCVPYFISNQAVDGGASFGGKINQIGTVANPYNNYDFAQNGVLSPFVAGTAVGVGTNQIGGNGAYNSQLVSLAAKLDFLQTYGRFDFDVTEGIHFFVTGFYDKEHQFTYLANVRANGASASSALASGFKLTAQNAFLPPAVAAAIAASGTGLSGGVATFNLGKYFDVSNIPPSNTSYTNENIYGNAGFEGKLGKFDWQVSYTDSKVTQANVANETFSTARFFAALDSVLVNGTPTCYVSTVAAYAANFPGCVPLNPFGPSATTAAQLAYVLQPTRYVGITKQQDVSGSISGPLFDLWAGPISLALSGEYRKLNYELTSEGEPANVTPLDCVGLGLLPARTSCVSPTATNVGTTTIYPNGSAGRTPVSQKVTEVAIEADVPVLKDLSFAQDVHINLAGRYAKYTSTGNVVRTQPYTTQHFDAKTWKAGLDWNVNDMLTIRATRSRDFRAPNLNDLYLPGRTQGLAAGTDLLTGAQIGVTSINGTSYTATQQVGGNPNLKPEVGNTTTVGVVVKPTSMFSLAVDYYDITINDAITTVDGSASTIQNACYDSGGSSPYCALQVRPGGFTRTTANQAVANSATLFYTALPLNIAKVQTHGVDFEANYRTSLGGQPLALRILSTWQPHLRSVQPGTPSTDASGVSVPKVRIQGAIRYNLTDALRIDWTTRWRSHLNNVDPLLGLQVAPGSGRVAAATFTNLNISYKITPAIETYFNITNLFDERPPVYTPLASGSPFASGAGGGGVGFYPGDDGIGRYFTIGARAKF